MAFESQQQAVCERVVESCNGLNSNLSALDLSSIEYVAFTSSEHITVLIIFNNDFVQMLQIIHKLIFAICLVLKSMLIS